MADLAKAAGLSGDENLLEGASKLLCHLWNVAWRHAPGTLDGDADDLHDMRVATRRLRSALQNFEGDADAPLVAPHLRREMKEWRRALGKLGDTLGAVRDCDVLNDYLSDYAKTRLRAEIDDASGLAEFRRHLQEQRADAFAVMVKKVNKATRPGALHEEFARFSLGLPAASGPNPSLKSAARLILPQRKAEALIHAPSLQNAHDEFGQHELRKALKRLRYTLEFFAPCFDESVKARVKQITQLQDTLGEMQDRSVLQSAVQAAFDGAQIPTDAQAFLTYGANRRRRLLTQARSQWTTLHDEFFGTE
jgi:CHAD domain-containing protein